MKKSFKPILCLVFVLVLGTVFTATPYSYAASTRPSKVEDTLWEYMQESDDDKLIPIGIVFNDIDDEALSREIKAQTGMDPEVYRDDEQFDKVIASKITEVLESKLGYEEAHKVGNDGFEKGLLSEKTAKIISDVFSDDLRDFSIDSQKIIEFIQSDRSLSAIDYTILEVRNTFQREKYRVTKEMISEQVDSFVSELVVPRKNEVIYAGRDVSSLYIKACKEDILEYAQQTEVQSIFFADLSVRTEPMLNNVSSQVRADSNTGTKGTNYNNGQGYKGTGINIGIIESSGVCDTTSPHYSAMRTHIIENGTAPLGTSVHASLVTAIVAGNRVAFNSRTYEGIASNANIFITQAHDVTHLFSGLNVLADYGVNVINISMGIEQYKTYSYIDRELDDFINTTDIICVVAVGNEGDEDGAITSPALALNCIAVGNLATKNSMTQIIGSMPYSVHHTSSSFEPSCLPNKPDVCAPGTYVSAIQSLTDEYNFYYELMMEINPSNQPSGTSFAAPVVTGIIAQMLQAKSFRIGRPQAIKAKIINSARPSRVSTVDNPTENNSFIYERSGAGMVDSVNAVTGQIYKHAWNHQAVQTDFVTQSTVSLTAGQKIRATLAFSNKNTGVIINDGNQYYDMDLCIKDAATGRTLQIASGYKNNVEIVEYTATESCTVYIQTRIYRNLSNSKTDWALEIDC